MDLVERFVSVAIFVTDQVDPVTETTTHYLTEEVIVQVNAWEKVAESEKAVTWVTRGFPKRKQVDASELYHHTN